MSDNVPGANYTEELRAFTRRKFTCSPFEFEREPIDIHIVGDGTHSILAVTVDGHIVHHSAPRLQKMVNAEACAARRRRICNGTVSGKGQGRAPAALVLHLQPSCRVGHVRDGPVHFG